MAHLAENRKARYNFEILESFEAGIELVGHEVKSVKAGRADLTGAYIIVRGGEAFIQGLSIPPYQVNNTPKDYDMRRVRRLLLNKKELWQLAAASDTKGLTLIPLSLYNNRHRIKVEFAVARGKKKFDKRASIKKREADRDMRRAAKLN